MSGLAPFDPRIILCPVDFSELSDLALKYAAVGAKAYGSRLLILHAETFDLPRYFSRGERDRLVQELAVARQKVRSDLVRHVGRVLGPFEEGLIERYEVLETHPVDAVLEGAGREGTGLIVLGTHGYGGLKRMVLGSVTENVIRHSKIPVFAVRQKEHQFIDVSLADLAPRLDRILCPVNITEVAKRALEHAVSLAERFGARLSVLYSLEGEGPPDESSARENLCAWIAEKVRDRCAFDPVVRRGNAAEQILAHARNDKADLIVMGAEHRPFLDATFFGKTTELVLRHAPAPVFVTPFFRSQSPAL